MKKIAILFSLIFPAILCAEGVKNYTEILNTTINLNKDETANLILYDGYSDFEVTDNTSLKAVLTIKGGKNNSIDFPFIDETKDGPDSDKNGWPVYRWADAGVNTVMSNFIYLQGNNVIDLDGNGENEIYVYGLSSHGTGHLGKVFSFEKSGNQIVKKYPVLYCANYDSIVYYLPEKLLITAHYLGTIGSEGDGDYEFIVSEQKNGFTGRQSLAITKKPHTTEYGPGVIEENIADILTKYELYKKGRVDDREKNKFAKFTKKYWGLMSDKKYSELKKSLASKVTYYTSEKTPDQVVKDKERIMVKNSGLKFELSDFLAYTDNGFIYVEYDKSFKSDKTDSYGFVRSLLTLKKEWNSYKINGEKDIYDYNKKIAGQ